jgi:hypothetical protein
VLSIMSRPTVCSLLLLQQLENSSFKYRTHNN